MDFQRIRTLTTTRLHTDMDHVYEDIRIITGLSVLTNQIPSALYAMAPYLRSIVTDERFWKGAYDPSHVGEMDIPPMDERHMADFRRNLETTLANGVP